jgi:hypothetical protein
MVSDRRLRLCLLLVLGLGAILLAVGVSRRAKPAPTISLVLADGSMVRILATTYGTNHVIGPPLARMVSQWPPPLQALAGRLFGLRAGSLHSTSTPRSALVVWLDDVNRTTNTPPYSGYDVAFLADGSGFVSGDGADVHTRYGGPQAMVFYAIPRRDRVVTLEFYHHDPKGTVTYTGHLPLENPLYGRFPQWQPQTLPATNRVGDVEVVVHRLSTGHNNNTSHIGLSGGGKALEFGTNCADGRNRSICLCTFRPLVNTNEVWCLASEEVSDATGNSVGNTSLGWGGYDKGYFTFEPGLWPAESAWKLACEIKRVKGFSSAETFGFYEVPLGRVDVTNQVGWMTNFGGVTLALETIVRRAPNTNNSWTSSELSQVQFGVTITNDLHLDLISARVDDGTKLECGSWESGGTERRYLFRVIPLGARTADFVFAVQRSRRVEFMLKPELGATRLELPPARLR